MLDYYLKERARHAALRAASCAFDDAQTAIAMLSKEYEVTIAIVRRTSGNRCSMFIPGSCPTIRLNTDCLNWLTVIHEFAHALDDASRRKTPSGMVLRRTRVTWHTAVHAELVDILARKIVERGWIDGIPAERIARENENLARRERAAAMANDPAVIRAKKIEKRKAQIDRLQQSIRRCMIRETALTTRLRNARRSLTALERAQEKP